MDGVNKTLYIPLFGKAYVSRRGILLHDPKAEEIWAREGFALKGKAASRWLAFYMSMRARVFDRWLREQMDLYPNAAVLHLGCGMDSRVLRVGTDGHCWYDVDFPEVIRERKRYFEENQDYRMIPGDVRDAGWMANISGTAAIVVMEGISMYLERAALTELIDRLGSRFDKLVILVDCYTEFAAKASRVKNPVNEVGVTVVYGLDDPLVLETDAVKFEGEHTMTPKDLIRELNGFEKGLFRKLYAGKMAGKLYKLYEFRKKE